MKKNTRTNKQLEAILAHNEEMLIEKQVLLDMNKKLEKELGERERVETLNSGIISIAEKYKPETLKQALQEGLFYCLIRTNLPDVKEFSRDAWELFDTVENALNNVTNDGYEEMSTKDITEVIEKMISAMVSINWDTKEEYQRLYCLVDLMVLLKNLPETEIYCNAMERRQNR